MSTKILVPTLGEAISEAVLAAWLFKPGDSVRRGDEIAELETDKATMTLESPANGVLLSILVPTGATVTTGQLLALIGKPGEAAEVEREPVVEQPSGPAPEPVRLQDQQNGQEGGERRRRISPAARKMARKLGIDLTKVEPEKAGARITTHDVERYQQSESQETSRPTDLPFHRIELSRIQKVVAERMVESAQIPQFSVSMDADASRLLSLKRELAEQGQKVSLTAMLVQLAARALKQHPLLNARFDQDGMLVYDTVNIGVAAATPAGLVVPVIHRAEELNLAGIARRLVELTQAARENRLSLDQVSGATFTISNLGMYGVGQFVPLINPPQSAILGVGAARLAAQPTPDWGIQAVWLLNLTVSADHRVLDGEAAAQFLATLKSEIEKANIVR